MKGLLGFPKGDKDFLTVMGLPKVRPRSAVPEALPVTGPALWLDADDRSTITISTGVSAWANKGTSGGSASQATGSNQPTYGTRKFGDRYVLDFDGSNDRLDMTYANSSNACTWFYVGQADDAVTVVVGTQGNNGYEHQLGGAGLLIYDRFAGSPDITMGNLVPGYQPFVCGYRLNSGVSSDGRLNYTTQTAVSTSFAVSSSGNLAIMFDHISGLIVRRGAVAEILQYSTVLSDDDFDLVMQYLGKKWNIQVNA